ncbi:MAG: Membrane-bound lytic murein transglycosylase precursor [Pseudomonadota bacterium]
MNHTNKGISLKIKLGLCLALFLTGCANVQKQAETNPADISTAAENASTSTTATTTAIPPTATTPPQLLAPLNAPIAKAKIDDVTEPPADIWVRIRQGFAMPDLENDLVKDREVWYAARPDYMVRMTERSRRYLFHIVEELERRNMPTELALLPFIESAFNPEAVSSAKAAGMWQFMPATGKYFDLHGMFGDWHLALAAYNWGEGSVGRALAKNKAAGLGLSYSELRMPNETRYYVPKLQAVKNIIAQPQNFNVRLPLIQNHPYFKSVSITRDIDVKLAANFSGVSMEDFKALNPSMSRPVILAAGTPEILLPWDNADRFQRRLEEHAQKQLASWTAWTVPKTMKVSEVSKLVKMTEAELRSVNQIPKGMQVKQGSTLLVVRQGALDADVTEHLADNAIISFAPEIVLRRMMVKVQKGDTLATLASRHGVSPSNIAAWNKLKVPVALKPGQSIAILVPTTASSRGSKNTSKKPSSQKGVKASTGAPKAKQAKVQSKPSAPKTTKPNSPNSSVRN